LNGGSLLGLVEEFDLPSPTFTQAEFKALGLLGTLSYPTGVEQLEARLKFTCIDAVESAKLMNPYTSSNLQLRGNLESYDVQGRSNQVPYVAFLVVRPKDVPLGMFKPKENAEFEQNYVVDSIKLEIDGNAIFEFNATNNTFEVNGSDIVATYRANLGF